MEMTVWISHFIFLIKIFRCYGSDRVDFMIALLHRQRYTVGNNTTERSASRSCYDLCRKVCVSFDIKTSQPHEKFQMELLPLKTERYDVIIVDEILGIPPSLSEKLVVIPSYMYGSKRTNCSSNCGALSELKEMSIIQPTVGLPSSLKEFILLYLKEIGNNVIVVFHDDSTAYHVGYLLDHLSDQKQGVEVMVYSTRCLQTPAHWELVLTHCHKHLYSKGIHALLLGIPETVLNTLKMVNSFDGQSNRTTNFRHLSHWLVLTNVVNPDIFLPVVNRLENVALVELVNLHRRRPTISSFQTITKHVQSAVNTYFTSEGLNGRCRNERDLKTHLIGYLKAMLNRPPQEGHLTVWALTGVGNTSTFDEVEVLDKGNVHRLSDSLYPNKKYQWNGVHLLISTKPWPGYVKKITHGSQTTYEGMCIELLKSMADALNFTYTIKDVPDGEWGTIVNRSWTGLVRQLQDRAVDLAVADIGFHGSRDLVMDYVYPTFKTEVIDILYRLHDDSDMSLERLTSPVKPIILLIMAGSLCAVTALYVAVEYVDVVVQIRGRHRRLIILFWKSVWYLIGSILSQGGSERPRSCSGRLLMASWWLFCIIFAAMYSATLTVSFCVQRTVVPFTSLHDMVYSSDYKWGMFNGSINILHFATSENPLYKATYSRTMEFAKSDPDVLSKDMDRQLDKVINEKYAFISSRNSLNVMIQRAPMGVTLATLGETLYPSSVAFGVPTNSPRLPEFERLMRNIKENGFLQYWIGKYWNRTRPSTGNFQLGGDPLPLRKILNVFCVIGLGVAMALTSLLCEGLLNAIRNKIKDKLKGLGDDKYE